MICNHAGHCFLTKPQETQQVTQQVHLLNHWTSQDRLGGETVPQSHPPKGGRKGNLIAWCPAVSHIPIHLSLPPMEFKTPRFWLTPSNPPNSHSGSQIPCFAAIYCLSAEMAEEARYQQELCAWNWPSTVEAASVRGRLSGKNLRGRVLWIESFPPSPELIC